jgi:hypothetical protein
MLALRSARFDDLGERNRHMHRNGGTLFGLVEAGAFGRTSGECRFGGKQAEQKEEQMGSGHRHKAGLRRAPVNAG